MAEMDKTVDPALWPLIEGFPPIDLSAATLPAFRTAMHDLSIVPDPATHPDVRIEELSIEGGSGAALRCLLFTPEQRNGTALLHLHGGGFVMGSPRMDMTRNVALARATGCVILSVDYRLAPEHPYPAGVDDCHAALVWLGANAGVNAGRIGVIGESAGGGLAASLALRARERLAFQVLIYPMLVPPSESIDDAHRGRYIWTRASNAYAWEAYLSGGRSLPAADLSGLPPTFLAVGELDLFVHDNLAYVQRLLLAGCSVEAHVYPGAIHGFDRLVDAPVSVRYTRDLETYIRGRTWGSQSPDGWEK